MLRMLFRLTVLALLLGVAMAFYYGYRWGGIGPGADRPVGTSGGTFDADRARRTGAEIAETVAEGAGRAEQALAETRLTAKIKSKMALDDTIEASRINVDTDGTVVTLRGTVVTSAQHQRVLQLARETAGVTKVVDRVDLEGK